MGRWVSIYLRDEEFRKLARIVEEESRRRGRRVSFGELVKEWVIERLREEKLGDG